MGDTQFRGRKGSYNTSETGLTSSVGSISSYGRDDEGDEPERSTRRAKRTNLTQNACLRCRQKKSKCDGARPSCARCLRNSVECQYDIAEEGMTRMQNLQQQLDHKHDDYQKLQQVFNQLQTGDDQAASSLLARLRMGANVDQLLTYMRESAQFTPQEVPPVRVFPYQQQQTSPDQHRLQSQYYPDHFQQETQSPLDRPLTGSTSLIGPAIVQGHGQQQQWQGSDSGAVERSTNFIEQPTAMMTPHQYGHVPVHQNAVYPPAMPDEVSLQQPNVYQDATQWHNPYMMPPPPQQMLVNANPQLLPNAPMRPEQRPPQYRRQSDPSHRGPD